MFYLVVSYEIFERGVYAYPTKAYCRHNSLMCLCFISFTYKEGPGDGITKSKVYVLCFIILERLVKV